MQPYGVRGPHIYRDEEYGPQSKYASISSNKRKKERRIAHKIERAKTKQKLMKELFS